MKILELNIIEFGALKNKKIEFGDGVNVVFGDNEAGKSTIALFIKFMLYGLARKSARGVERERALSLDGSRAAGTMTLELGGVKYFLERSSASGGKRSEVVRLTNLSTGESTSEGIAELLVGVPQEVFESSVLIGQMKAAEIKGEQLGSAIDNMLSSADESVDISAVLRRIDDVRKEYKLNRGEGGRLYEAERQITELSSRRAELIKKELEAQELEARLERTKRSIEKTEESYAQSKQLLDDMLGAGVLLRFEELSKKKEELGALALGLATLEKSNTAKDFLPDRMHAVSLENALMSFEDKRVISAEREKEVNSIAALPEKILTLAALGERLEGGSAASVLASTATLTRRKKGLLAGGILCALLGAVSTVLGAILLGIANMYVGLSLLGGGCALAAAAVCLLLLSANRKKRISLICDEYGVPYSHLPAYFSECAEALARRRSFDSEAAFCRARLESARTDELAATNALYRLLEKTAALHSTIEDNIAICQSELTRIKAFCDEREQKQAELCALESYTERLAGELSAYDEEALRASVKTDPHALTAKAIENAKMHERYDRERLAQLRVQKENQAITLAGMKTSAQAPDELGDKIQILREMLDSDTKYFDALMLAKEHIERASTQMSKNVTPEISKRAGELMSVLSGGAHEFLQTTKTLDVSVENNGFLISSELLSGGAKDALYICLRVALAEKIFDGECPPLILDEALCQLDDTRAARLLELLCGIFENTQCIIFTCHKREAELLEEIGKPFKLHLL